MDRTEQQLRSLTNDFSDKNGALRCWQEQDKKDALRILKQYYNIVEVSSGLQKGDTENSYVISFTGCKKVNESLLNEEDLDPDSDTDLEDMGFDLDSINDSSELENADELTVLKKRAADLAEKWKDTYKRISDLAKKLDLTVSHNDDLEIEVKKMNGVKSDIEQDVETVEDELPDKLATEEPDDFEDEESKEIDDFFGPSKFDDRADKLGPDEEAKQESLQNLPAASVNEEYPWNKNNGTLDLGQSNDPNELYLDPNMVDDDF